MDISRQASGAGSSYYNYILSGFAQSPASRQSAQARVSSQATPIERQPVSRLSSASPRENPLASQISTQAVAPANAARTTRLSDYLPPRPLLLPTDEALLFSAARQEADEALEDGLAARRSSLRASSFDRAPQGAYYALPQGPAYTTSPENPQADAPQPIIIEADDLSFNPEPSFYTPDTDELDPTLDLLSLRAAQRYATNSNLLNVEPSRLALTA